MIQNYINNIHRQQHMKDIKELLYSFCSEHGYRKEAADKALETQQGEPGIWGVTVYTRFEIYKMLQHIASNQ